MTADSAPNAAVDVCVVTTIHPPLNARIYDRGVKALVDAGLSVGLIAPWEEPANPYPTLWITTDQPKSRLGRVLHGYRTFRKALAVRANSYHFHDLDFLPWAVVLKLFRRVPVVYDCHEDYPQEIIHNKPWIPSPLRPLVSGLTRLVENALVRQLGWCITVIPELEARFTSLGVECIMVRNFTSKQARRELPHARAVVCIGSLSPAYGMHILLWIARELRDRGEDLELIVTDSFQEHSDRTEFLGAIYNEGLAIRVHDRVPSQEIDRLLTQASIGLSVEQDTPNMRQGYHAKLFEYMAMGLPIVASDIDSNRRLVSESESRRCGTHRTYLGR